MSGKTRYEPDIYWQLHSQGSGASFEGTYSYIKGSVKAIGHEFPTDIELNRIAGELSKLQKPFGYQLTAAITRSGREVHKYCMDVEAYNKNGDVVMDGSAGSDILDLMRDFADWIFDGINQEYEYRMSDECVDDAMQANEYTFTVDGKRED
jgi:hypothetical protein